MKLFLPRLLFLFLFSVGLHTQKAEAKAEEFGFFNGNEMSVKLISGHAVLTCADLGTVTVVQLDCRDTVLAPAEFDYFQGPKGTEAHAVELAVTHADGSMRTKTINYDSQTGLSESKINLWINSVVQKPLLQMGLNRIEYRLQQSGRVVWRGQFFATIKPAGALVCTDGEFFSNSQSDCEQPYTFCQRYFEERNHCQ